MNDFTGILTSLSKDICALNRHGQYTTIERISAHESQPAELDLMSGKKYVPHKTQPIVPDSESSNRSVNQAGNTGDASIGKFISHVIHFLHFNLNIKLQKSWEENELLNGK